MVIEDTIATLVSGFRQWELDAAIAEIGPEELGVGLWVSQSALSKALPIDRTGLHKFCRKHLPLSSRKITKSGKVVVLYSAFRAAWFKRPRSVGEELPTNPAELINQDALVYAVMLRNRLGLRTTKAAREIVARSKGVTPKLRREQSDSQLAAIGKWIPQALLPRSRFFGCHPSTLNRLWKRKLPPTARRRNADKRMELNYSHVRRIWQDYSGIELPLNPNDLFR